MAKRWLGCFLIGIFIITMSLAFPQESAAPSGGGITLNFNMHDIYLAAYILRAKNEPMADEYKNDLTALQSYMEEVSKESYDQLMTVGWEDIRPDYMNSDKLEKLKPFFVEAANAPAFPKLLSQTQSFAISSKEEWEKNYEKSLGIIKELTGQNLNQSFTLYFTHPGIKNNASLPNGILLWGHKEEWANYATCAIWYEILKSILGGDKITQAVLELLCFDHLKTQLNGGEYPPLWNDDPSLKEMKEIILPEWKLYLTTVTNKNIKTFLEQMKNKLQ